MNSNDLLIRLFLVFLLIALNAFFVAAEFSIVSVRRTRISQLVAAGDAGARTVQSLQKSLARLLSTTQLGITLSSLALGWIGESTMALLVGRSLALLPLPVPWRTFLTHGLSIPLAFVLVAYLQIVLGELCPKSLALIYAEPMARFLAPAIGAISRVFTPLLWILNQSTRFLLTIARIQDTDIDRDNRVTPEELQLLISLEGESTGLEAGEREIINNIFEFSEVSAEEIMIPRNRVSAISLGATFAEFLHELAVSGHSRYPVKGDSLDDIRGSIDFKTLAVPLARGELTRQTPIDAWVQPVRFFPESTPLSELLGVMRKGEVKMVIIVNEFGGTAGLLTHEDLIDEILGTRSPENHFETVELQMLDESTFLVQAQMNLEDVNDILGLQIPLADEYQTLGGFLLHRWQKIPARGETLEYGALEFTIVSTEGPRLEQIRIYHRREG
jgi:CBS domain containing-hemolysin-like protein